MVHAKICEPSLKLNMPWCDFPENKAKKLQHSLIDEVVGKLINSFMTKNQNKTVRNSFVQ